MNDILSQLQEAVIVGEPEQARELATQALEAGIAPLDAVDQALNPGMQIVGDRYECGDYFIPDLMMAAEAMKAAMEKLEPELTARQEQLFEQREKLARLQGDISDIRGQYATTRNEYDTQTIIESQLAAAKQDLTEEMRRLLAEGPDVLDVLVHVEPFPEVQTEPRS